MDSHSSAGRKIGPAPVSPKPRVNKPAPLVIENSNFNNFNHYRPPGYDESMAQPGAGPLRGDELDDGDDNPLPLPPRDRTRPTVPTKPRHQRKHPLIYPTNLPNPNRWVSSSGDAISNPDSPLSPPLTGSLAPSQTDVANAQLPPAKPPRAACNLDDSYDSQIASELEALDDMDEETNQSVTSSSSLYQSKDHVSCEDLLDFACDRPNSKRTRGPAQGMDSDEVHFVDKTKANLFICIKSHYYVFDRFVSCKKFWVKRRRRRMNVSQLWTKLSGTSTRLSS